MRRYVENTILCRRKWLLDHFNVKVNKRVQRCCDVSSDKVEVVGSSDDSLVDFGEGGGELSNCSSRGRGIQYERRGSLLRGKSKVCIWEIGSQVHFRSKLSLVLQVLYFYAVIH